MTLRNRFGQLIRGRSKTKAAQKTTELPSNGPSDKRQRSLSSQILRQFLLIALIPLIIVSLINFLTARETVLKGKAEYLSAIGQGQVKEIHSYFVEVSDFVQLVSQTPGVIMTLERLAEVNEENLEQTLGMPKYKAIEENLGPILRNFASKFGFSQIYLINPSGMVVYSVPFLDLKYRNLENEPNGPTELGKVFRRTSALMSTQASDFRLYPPLNQPLIFVTSPVLYKGTYLGTIALAIDDTKLNKRLSYLTDYGETAEIIFASKVDDQILFLNNLREQPDAAFKFTIPYEPAENEELNPIQRAVRGMYGSGLAKDYKGDEVIALWEYLPNLRMGLVIKIEKNEIFAPINYLLRINLGVAMLTVAIVIVVATLLSRSITRPINTLTATANQLADGDLRIEIPCRGHNEVSQLSKATKVMSKNLKSLVGKVKTTGSEIKKTVQFIEANAQAQVSSAQQTDSSAIESNTTAKKIAAISKDLATTMSEVNQVTLETAIKAEAGLDVLTTIQDSMKELDKANLSVAGQLELIQKRADAITSIILTMTKVADQTNLLSLNASIEARKAGPHGRGFSGVATEMRRLADQAATATLEIEGSIKDMLWAIQTGISEMRGFSSKVSQSVQEITNISSRLEEVIQQVQGLPLRFDEILEGVQSQVGGTEQINQAMSLLAKSAQQTASAVKETHLMLGNLRQSVEILDGEISHFKT